MVAVAAIVTMGISLAGRYYNSRNSVENNDPNLYRETATPITDKTYFDQRDLPILDPFYTKQNVLILDAVRRYFDAIGEQNSGQVYEIT
ncbi:hypothetical protein ACFWF7_17570 [Nocardia sp. NPDC060256]|uniref:hypothetical protein n=1 Tax=unclassified Nocardia TaxID=2637762 RepID=UPI003669CCF5